MIYKTNIDYDYGFVTGVSGSARLLLPAIRVATKCALGWRLCSLSKDFMILFDCLADSETKNTESGIMKQMHYMLS